MHNFFCEKISRFTFLNAPIQSWEGVKNSDLTVYDGRVKLVSVEELLQQDIPQKHRDILQEFPARQEVIVNYIVQIDDEPLLGKTGDVQIDEFMTELNDRFFHAQHFTFMYLPMIEEAAKNMTGVSVWEMEEEQRLFHFTMACYLGILGNEYPFGELSPAFWIDGLPEKGEASLMIVFPHQ